MYDVDGNGHIDLIEMTKIVKSIYNMMGPNQGRRRRRREQTEILLKDSGSHFFGF